MLVIWTKTREQAQPLSFYPPTLLLGLRHNGPAGSTGAASLENAPEMHPGRLSHKSWEWAQESVLAGLLGDSGARLYLRTTALFSAVDNGRSRGVGVHTVDQQQPAVNL